MKILLSPSEGKKSLELIEDKDNFDFLSSLILNDEVLKNRILDYVTELKGDEKNISEILGVKNLTKALDELCLCLGILKSDLAMAIELYNGVAFKALDFKNLPLDSQKYILENVFIFSNLFGVLRAKDFIPYYKLNQNCKNKKLKIDDFYKKNSMTFDEFFNNEEILDLRAEFYIKSYKPKGKRIEVDFMKNNKKISHYAKYYRGVFLKTLSLNPNKKFQDLEFDSLVLKDMMIKNNLTKLIYEICE